MKLIRRILNNLNGLHYSQEYLCLSKETFEQPLHAWLVIDNIAIKDITNQHCFTGYSPLIIALPFSGQELPDIIHIAFLKQELSNNDVVTEKDADAMLKLKKFYVIKAGTDDLYFYEGVHGTHRFTTSFQQRILDFYNKLYNNKPGNVFLEGNLYHQVQIAYSIPRTISLITVQRQQLFNLFPTDLHGSFGRDYYIVSLRHAGEACHQVEASGRIIISQIQPDAFKLVYSLGKNHMQPPKPFENFPFSNILSVIYRLPVPQDAVAYKELELAESFTHGIHKQLLFKVISKQQLRQGPTLAHIHNVYASWRYRNALPGNYLFR